ncbi:large ribosomal subunit protein mL54 [Salminus brasiliensis]|uniref:large ribosomal subunit protein mL54 n=1 Tax=Salminus brasiliensis TaxID=930266 RepID=UPI003B836E21
MALRSLLNPLKTAASLRLSPSVADRCACACACAFARGPLNVRGYAKKVAAKGKSKGMVKDVLKGPEVCKDPAKLVSHAMGVNIYKQGEDPALKPKEEYPEWLFQLNLGPPKQLSELDPESYEYWNRLRKEHIWRSNKLSKGKKV